MFSDAIFTLAGAIFGGLIILHINSYSVIQKKIKAEAIQKLKIDSIVNTINGINELKLAYIKLASDMKYLAMETKISMKEERDEKMESFYSKAHGYFHSLQLEIEKLIFVIETDMQINGEYRAIRNEIENLKIVDRQMGISFSQASAFNAQDNITKIIDYLNEHNINKKIGDIIEILLEKYKEKLDKEQEDWLDKLLNYFKRR